MANILVTGANGQLGSEIRRCGFCSLDDVFYTGSEELDIRDSDAVRSFICENEIDTIINCAAYTVVDKAEKEPAKAESVNVKGVKNLAKVAAEEDCLLIHISTDYIFDGNSDRPYMETDVPHPLNVYGHTKLQAEEEILKSDCLYIIIRTSWLYSAYGNNFVKTILRLMSEGKSLTVVDAQFGSPTYAGDLADAILMIFNNSDLLDNEGIYNFCNSGYCSWYELATAIAEECGYEGEIKAVPTSDYPTVALRPPYSVLNTDKIKKHFGIEAPNWRDALKRCIKEINKK